jgi:hypothetical protein
LPTSAPVAVCLSSPLPLARGLSLSLRWPAWPFMQSAIRIAVTSLNPLSCGSLPSLHLARLARTLCLHISCSLHLHIQPLSWFQSHLRVPSLSPHLTCSPPVGSKPTRNAVERSQYDQPARGKVACMPRAAKTLRGGTVRLTRSPKGRQQKPAFALLFVSRATLPGMHPDNPRPWPPTYLRLFVSLNPARPSSSQEPAQPSHSSHGPRQEEQAPKASGGPDLSKAFTPRERTGP